MKNFIRSAVVSTAVIAGAANAAVPADVTSALETAKADGVSVAGIVLTVVIAIAAFKYIRRAL